MQKVSNQNTPKLYGVIVLYPIARRYAQKVPRYPKTAGETRDPHGSCETYSPKKEMSEGFASKSCPRAAAAPAPMSRSKGDGTDTHRDARAGSAPPNASLQYGTTVAGTRAVVRPIRCCAGCNPELIPVTPVEVTRDARRPAADERKKAQRDHSYGARSIV